MTDQSKWEYKTIVIDPRHTAENINYYGSNGWEAFAVSVQFTSHYVWFKRPIWPPARS